MRQKSIFCSHPCSSLKGVLSHPRTLILVSEIWFQFKIKYSKMQSLVFVLTLPLLLFLRPSFCDFAILCCVRVRLPPPKRFKIKIKSSTLWLCAHIWQALRNPRKVKSNVLSDSLWLLAYYLTPAVFNKVIVTRNVNKSMNLQYSYTAFRRQHKPPDREDDLLRVMGKVKPHESMKNCLSCIRQWFIHISPFRTPVA